MSHSADTPLTPQSRGTGLRRILTDPKERSRFLKFCVVGASGAVVDFGILNFCVKVLHIPLWLGERPGKLLSISLSFILAVLNNFLWNRLWVYPETRKDPIRKQLGQFALVNLIGYVINVGITYTGDQWVLGPAGILATQVAAFVSWLNLIDHYTFSYNASKVIATGVVLFWNFFINRVWTFGHVE